MKKIVSAILVFMLLLTNVSVFAVEYPSSFWSVEQKYIAAKNAKDHAKIIEYGTQLISIVSTMSDCKEKRENMVCKYFDIGESYAALGRYEESAAAFDSLISYASPFGDQFGENIKGAKARSLQYTTVAQMYVDGGTSPYYGAINEKQNGVLFGLCSNGETRKKLSNESMVLTYQELGQNLLAYNTSVVQNASNNGLAVEFALNCPNQAYDIRNIQSYSSYLKQISDMLSKYPNVPVYLRFAAEFDIWDNLADPESFKAAFRYVSDYFKSRNPNVAMVWSLTCSSNWYVNVHDYYPGDQYVDWVGVSLYARKYFLGDPSQTEDKNVVFKCGENSDPVLAMKEIVDTYGNRKPIMLAESGMGHKVFKNGENTTQFALERLKEYYTYLPMVYPQIKLMAHFDWLVENNGETDDFRLSSNQVLQNEYLKLTKGGRFIQDKFSNNVDLCYRQVYNGISVGSFFEVACYAHKYKNDVKSVVYYIDNDCVGVSNNVPFSTYIDAHNYSGNHILKGIITFADGQTLTTQSSIYINNSSPDITVEISGDPVAFDQEPILYNSRTLVPMRKIFEELGATVSWDADTQTATGKRGDRTVKITVGQKKMYVNGREYTLDTSPVVVAGRTLVPVRAVAEGMGCEVEWDGRYNLVSITPKVFTWSDWTEHLPGDVDDDLYYIEKRTEYSYRIREKEYFTSSYKMGFANYIRTNIYYGPWSSWQDGYISSSDDREVQTRTQSTPKRYHYAHYCTGNISDKDNRYKTWDRDWHDECLYHDLGWFDSPLPYSEDSTYSHVYYVNGKKYRCSNTCYRWYLMETTGGDYTQYRYRDIEYEYEYWEWGDWSRWSNWSTQDPYDDYYWDDDIKLDVDERTVYRYKEK